MKFEVKYRNKGGQMVTDVIDVGDRNGVYSELRRQGITPISISEVGEKKKKGAAGGGSSSVLSRILLVLALAAAAFAIWYFLIADGAQQGKVNDFAGRLNPLAIGSESKPTPSDQAPAKPRGTGAVKVKLTK